MSITTANFILAYPEWSNAATEVLDNAVAVANALALPLYTNSAEEDDRRYLEAAAILYTLPYARDMRRSDSTQNPYRIEATRRDINKGTQYRAPGWTIPLGVP